MKLRYTPQIRVLAAGSFAPSCAAGEVDSVAGMPVIVAELQYAGTVLSGAESKSLRAPGYLMTDGGALPAPLILYGC